MQQRRVTVGVVFGALLALSALWLTPGNRLGVQAAENNGVITGVVTSAKGPEAGVWVIAETSETQTKFRKIVVTDDRGRFVVPDLPQVNFNVWVRGYGLADSKPVPSTVGKDLKLSATVAKTPQEAAQVYPANYWYSLMEPPKASEFPGTGPSGNGISPQIRTQSQWVDNMKSCMRCHQVGNKINRTIPDKNKYQSTGDAWDHRVTQGQRGTEMSGFMTRFGRDRGLKMFSSWTDRIAAGEVPKAPPRPTGTERNVVLTVWDWADQYAFVHDEVSTDKRNPRLNPNGPIYGVDWGNDHLTIVDPVANTAKMLKVPQLVDSWGNRSDNKFVPYRDYGSKIVHQNPASPHNPMLDSKGRVWITTGVRPAPNPEWCKSGTKFADYFPIAASGHHAGYYDPKTEKFTLIETCFGTHHLQFAEDANETLYFSAPGGPTIGWINTKLYDQTSDAKASEGWCPTVVDTNGDGKITKPWNEPAAVRPGMSDEDVAAAKYGKLDPKLDTRVVVGSYGIVVAPDHSVWGTSEAYPGTILRLTTGANPPETCITEVFEVPSELQGVNPNSGEAGFKPRGIDVDRNGVIWTALAGTDQFAAFDRRKCKTVNGPTTVEGRHCREGWKLYPMPGPTLKGTDFRADYLYYNWVDQYNTLGLGNNIPVANGSGSDSLLALKPDTGEWVVMRVPYPMGFHSRGLDGRIDDPNAGWKGRGLYATNGSNAVWHTEGGAGMKPILVKFQIRPDPLAR